MEIVDAILDGTDVLCVMPTGAGKSICYQVPAMILDGVTLVISPLISLMKDQVGALTQSGICAAYLNSSLTQSQYNRALENIRRGVYKIVYVAPERLGVPAFIEALENVRVDLVAVDEAHCISQWGQDFRPSYLKIAELIDHLGYRPTVAAFTATATAEVKDDIEYALRLRTPLRITTGFDRPNLRFEVQRPTDKFDALADILKKHRGESGIVYCSTRRTVEEVGTALCERGIAATVYHAGLSDDVRRGNQDDFVYDRCSVMVATNAFGMGIDKSNVSFVVHYNMPMDIESYYQEAGRAGRDGSEAECILLYSPSDVHTNRFLIANSEPNPELTPEEQELMRAKDYERLKLMTFYSTTNACLRGFILDYFGERAPAFCGNCSSCLNEMVDTNVTLDAQKILSCIKRTGERYGKKMICDILRGSRNEKILSLGLDSQTTYGLMKEQKEATVRQIIDHLEREGYIESRGTEYPTLALTPQATGVLFGGEAVLMKLPRPKDPLPKKGRKTRAPATETTESDLLADLKVIRRRIADERKVPAYIVFTDATLVDMCAKLPTTEEELLEVSGVGESKLRLYGERFLYVIRAHVSYLERKRNGDL